LADFIAIYSDSERSKEGEWVLNDDGVSSQQGSGVGIAMTSPQGDVLKNALYLIFYVTNNVT
jgi:hypothetical protein